MIHDIFIKLEGNCLPPCWKLFTCSKQHLQRNMHRIDRSIDCGVEEWYTKWFDLCFEGKLRNTWLPKSYDLFYKLQNMLVDMCHFSHDQHTNPWRIIPSHVKNKWHLKFQEYLAYDIICVYIMYHEAPRGYGLLQFKLGCFKVYAF